MFLLRWDWTAIGAGLIGLHPNLTESAATTIGRHFRHHHQSLSLLLAERPGVRGSGPEQRRASPDRPPREGPEAILRIRVDTIAGMAISNLIALAIMIATAATLHAHGITTINTATEAAQALKPRQSPGASTFALFSLGN